MNTSPNARTRFWVSLLGFVLSLSLPGVAHARGGSSVVYEPTLKPVEGTIPFAYSYTLTVTPPTNFPAGATSTVSFSVTRNPPPAGTSPAPIDDATMLGYVTFSPATLTFTSTQPQTVTVTLNLPPSAPAGYYGYQIYTQGWPSTIAFDDFGAAINVTATVGQVLTPPTVSIAKPLDQTVIPIAVGTLPIDVPFSFTAASAGSGASAITDVNADVDGTAVALNSSGLNTLNVSANGTLHVTAPGSHIVTARATNRASQATEANTFIVSVTAPPPTVSISSPASGATYTYRSGGVPVLVPITIVANSSFGGVRVLTAQLDGATLPLTLTGIGNLQATGSANVSYTTAGIHTLSVVATDDNGQATAQSSFTISVVSPTPKVTISAPSANQQFNLPTGATTMNVNYAFTTTSNNGFNVDSVSATLGANPVSPSTVGLATPTASSTGTLTGLGAGTYTLTAIGVSGGISAQASVTFTIKGTTVPPSVTISSPTCGAVFTGVVDGSPVSVPLSFTGTSNTAGGVITSLAATLDGKPVGIVAANIGQKVATGTATLSVTTCGFHTVAVTATDAYGTASASTLFAVLLLPGRTIRGETFFDLDSDGKQDCAEFGLAGVTVKLLDASRKVIATDTTDCDGDYSFTDLAPGTYTVSAVVPTALSATTPVERSVTVGLFNACGPDIGFALDFAALQKMSANGFTIGYWKNNLDKAISGKTNGMQVSKAALCAYTDSIGSLALSPYDDLTMKQASSIMGSTSSKPSDLLSKQLVASEYNYQSGAYIGGNRTVTWLFIWWGEYVLANPCKYSSADTLWAKDWFEAYNSSHGGLVDGPSS